MDVVLRCATCYPVRLGNCPDSLLFNIGIDPNTEYTYEICHSMGNVYEGTTTTDGDGNVSISTIDVPFDAYPGLFNKFAGSFRLTLYDNNGDAVTFTVSGTTYSCIAFSFRETVEVDECAAEVTCGCIFGNYGVPSNLIGKDGDFYINANNGSIYEKVDGEWTLFWSQSAGTIADGDYGDITVSGSGSVWTIDNQVVTFAKMQHISTQKLLGRHTAGSGDIQTINIDGGLTLNGDNLRRSALTGDVTASEGNNATTIANDAVTFAKMQNINTSRVLGRSTAGSGDVEEISIGTGLTLSGGTLSASSSGGKVIWAATNTTAVSANGTGYSLSNIVYLQSLLIPANTFQNGDIIELYATMHSLNNIGNRAALAFLTETSAFSGEERGRFSGVTNAIGSFTEKIFVGAGGAYIAPGGNYDTSIQINPFGQASAGNIPGNETTPVAPANGPLDPTKDYYWCTGFIGVVGVVGYSNVLFAKITRP